MIVPVLLCGGSGTRLWPLSRKTFPKQFSGVVGSESLFQASARRFLGTGFSAPLVVTGDTFRFVVTEQLDEIGIIPDGIIIEPEERNTAPAAIAAALFAARRDPRALVLLVSSDHAIADGAAFRAAINRGRAAAEAGLIVTVGIKASRPETGYGYLEAGEEVKPGVYTLTRFVEKPDQATAERLVTDPRYMWNAGVFLGRADVFEAAFAAHAPDILEAVRKATDAAQGDLSFTRIDPALWDEVRNESIDYAVMEHATNTAAVCFDGPWSDLGSWEAVWLESEKDQAGNAISSNATAYDCEDTLLRSEAPEIELVGIGLKGIVAVAMRDAVLVADTSDSQNVKRAVREMRCSGAKQATVFPIDHRPWGWFESLTVGDRFQVKRIHVHPGASLSLQSHHHRSEHWIVVKGTAKVTVDDDVRLVTENQSVYIPLGAVHRMENPGRVPMVLIEVQTGSYLGEDDIIRYEDAYER